MSQINYSKLMAQEPTVYASMTNSDGQLIHFVEHPFHGDAAPIIVVCHDLKFAGQTDFYDLEDMMASHGEYEPSFDEQGNLYIGRFQA